MSPATATPTTPERFSARERTALCRLRTRYQQDHDLFSAPELAHLRFVRWLYRSGRLES
jgi:hypothetical protein